LEFLCMPSMQAARVLCDMLAKSAMGMSAAASASPCTQRREVLSLAALLVPTVLPVLLLAHQVAVLRVAAFPTHHQGVLAVAGGLAAVAAHESSLRHAACRVEMPPIGRAFAPF